MVTLRPYGVQTQASGISQLNSGGNGYIGNAGLQMVGQALGGAVERGLGIDAESVRAKQQHEINRNAFEANIEKREQAQYLNSQKLSAYAKLSDLDIDVGAEAETLKSRVPNGGQGYTKMLQQSLDKKIGLMQKNLSFQEKQFLEPKILQFKAKYLSSADQWERSERINNDISNIGKIQKSLYDKVNDNPESVNEAKAQMNMLVENLEVEPRIKRKMLNEFDDNVTKLHYDYFVQKDPVGFLNKFKKIDIVSFDSAINHIFDLEGGYVAKDGRSNAPANFGINQKANPDIDVKNLTKDQAKQIYKTRYWDAINADSLPENMRLVAMDTAVNQGVDTAKELLAKSDNDPVKFTELRIEKYKSLNQSENIDGWINRANKTLQATQSQDAGVVERSYMGKASELIEKNIKEQETRQREFINNYAEQLKYNATSLSQEQLDAEVNSGRISYKNANIIKKAIASVEKEKKQIAKEQEKEKNKQLSIATDKTKIEILKNQDVINDDFRNQILNNPDIPEKQKLEIINFVDNKIDENKTVAVSNIKLGILNGDINYTKDIKDNPNITDADKITFATAQRTYDTSIAKAEAQKAKQQKQAYDSFIEKVSQETDNDLWSVEKLDEIRNDINTSDYDKLKARIEKRDEQTMLGKALYSEPKGSDLHIKAVNSEFNMQKQNMFDLSLPVDERSQNAIAFLKTSGGVVPNELKSIMQNMALKPNADNVEFINNIYQDAKLSQNKAVLNNLSDDVAITSNIYQSYLDVGNTTQQALSMLNEDLNQSQAKIKERGELSKDIIREATKDGKSFISEYGTQNRALIFFGDDYSDIPIDSDVYADLEADAKQQFQNAFIKTGNKDQSLQMAFDYIGKTYSKFNGEYMKYAPDVVTGYDKDLIENQFNEFLGFTNKHSVSLKNMLGETGFLNYQIVADTETEKAVKSKIYTQDGVIFKNPLSYLVVSNGLPIRNKYGNIKRFVVDIKKLEQIKEKEYRKEPYPITLPRG